jgi:hypothetical protein
VKAACATCAPKQLLADGLLEEVILLNSTTPTASIQLSPGVFALLALLLARLHGRLRLECPDTYKARGCRLTVRFDSSIDMNCMIMISDDEFGL